MRTIVVATDGSPAASAALDEAIDLARATGDRVLATTVWRALQGDFGLAYPSAALLNDLLDAERRHAEEVLEDARTRCAEAGVPVEVRLLTGDPAEQICALARDEDARLIAVGTHGHGSVVTLLVGSVSGAVIKRSSSPVLVVHDPKEAREQRRRWHLAASG